MIMAEHTSAAGPAGGCRGGYADRFEWERALRDADVPPGMKLTLFALGTYMNGDGGSAYPGVARLARNVGHSHRTVRRHLSQARHDGWLTVNSDLFGGRGKATSYRAAIPETRTPATGFEEKRGTPATQKGDTSDTKPGHPRPPTNQDNYKTKAAKKSDCPEHGPGACFFQFGTGWIHPEEGVA
jgi:Helix-turn-helix domain